MEVSDYYSTKDHFIVEDLFDFSSNEPGPDAGEDNGVFDGVNGNSKDSSTVTAGNGYGSSLAGYGQHFSTDFSQPCEEVAELEWLSNFVEDCYSHKFSNTINLSSSSDQTNQSSTTSNHVPAKTRSKRSRANPSNWASAASRIPILNPTQLSPSSSSSSDSGTTTRHPIIPDVSDGVRRCLHCGSDKTPQWRMGPMGPKTLCNACGVRYKSGRLVPEYRPAASPTFMVSEHSNSHRKVVELRRQKEMQKQQQMLFWS